MNEEKNKALEILKAAIIKEHGRGAVTQLSDVVPFDADSIIHSESIGLDVALGVGGYAKGRIIEIYGPESSGKTTLTLHAIANTQKAGGTCAFIDTEHALDVTYARNLGVDVDALLLSQPSYGEQALDIAELMCRSGVVDLIIVDSVAALTPKAELEGEMGDASVGAQARLMSKAMRKLVGVTSQTGTCIMFTNQIRMKIGVMFGSPETTTGGNALKFYASQRLDIRRIGKVELDGKMIGNKTRVKVIKNKVAPPFKEAEFDILWGTGIDKYSEVLDFGVQDDLIIKAGAYYRLPAEEGAEEVKMGQGRQNAIAFLRDNQDTFERLKTEILSNRGLE